MFSPFITLIFCRKRSLAKTICILMGFSLFILADTLVTMMLATLTGAYMALVIVAVSSWVLVIFIYSSISRHIRIMKSQLVTAAYPEQEFRHIAGLGLSMIFAICPGLLTDVIAIILYCLPLRLFSGTLIVSKNQSIWEETAQILSCE